MEFYRRAAEARRIAETAANPSERTDFLAIVGTLAVSGPRQGS
jgi:hypothetical protein